MEICSESGLGSNSAGDVSNTVKPQTAALGFRVKSGWAAAVLLKGSAHCPEVYYVQRIELSDPERPETRQPYHAAVGKLETDEKKINERVHVVQRIAEQSIAQFLGSFRQDDYTIRRAVLVVGSRNDPDSIANPHIRAHAFEGRLFRSVVEKCLRARGICADVLIERDAYGRAALELNLSDENVRGVIRTLGRATEVPWRAEQKLAALAAWLALD